MVAFDKFNWLKYLKMRFVQSPIIHVIVGLDHPFGKRPHSGTSFPEWNDILRRG
jgi:hypothetical protein